MALTATFDRLIGFGTVPRIQSEVLVDPSHYWAVGRAHHGVLQQAPQLAKNSDVHVLFHGDLDDGADRDQAQPRGVGSKRDAAESLAAQYARHGGEAVARLEGSHCAAIVDATARTITLVTDRTGSYPPYW